MTEWFRHWFGEEYLRLYAHRDTEDAEAAVALVDRLAPVKGRRVLDLACGPGRHMVTLGNRGARVVGCDLSAALLRHAGDATDAPVVRADIRALPFGLGTFDIVVNLFTSFGYFEDDREHQAVLDAVAMLLVPKGSFILDFLNSESVFHTLVPEETGLLGDTQVTIRRRITPDRRYVEKDVMRTDDGRGWHERVRLFTPDELCAMAQKAGLHVRTILGGYDAAAWHEASPRTILVTESA